jgi:hypothetical protein
VATERIKSGMMLTVDGDAGTVTLVDEVDPQTEANRLAQAQAEEEKVAKQKKAVLILVVTAVVGLIWWKRRR